MLTIPANVRIYLCTMPTDMRKSFDGLQVLVQQVLWHRSAVGLY